MHDQVEHSMNRTSPWSVNDLSYNKVVPQAIEHDPVLFYTIACASFIEASSHLYTQKLIRFFIEEPAVASWLQNVWKRDEDKHGAALQRYVKAAWPDLDWERAYSNFLQAYSEYCSPDQVSSTYALEMVGRCIIETSAAAFYYMIARVSSEPVLTQLVMLMFKDEITHYKRFYEHYIHFCQQENLGRVSVARTIWQRVNEFESEDVLYAYKSIYLACNPQGKFNVEDYRKFRKACRKRSAMHFPGVMVTKLVFRPLQLNPKIQGLLVPLFASAGHKLISR